MKKLLRHCALITAVCAGNVLQADQADEIPASALVTVRPGDNSTWNMEMMEKANKLRGGQGTPLRDILPDKMPELEPGEQLVITPKGISWGADPMTLECTGLINEAEVLLRSCVWAVDDALVKTLEECGEDKVKAFVALQAAVKARGGTLLSLGAALKAEITSVDDACNKLWRALSPASKVRNAVLSKNISLWQERCMTYKAKLQRLIQLADKATS